MSRDYTKAVRSGDSVALWMARLKRWRHTWERLCGKGGEGGRIDFRDAINLQLPDFLGVGQRLADAVKSPQVNVYLFARAHHFYTAQLYDGDPEVRSPYCGDGTPEMTEFEEVLLSRLMDEARLPSESRNVASDLCWAGFSWLWYGMEDFPTYEGFSMGSVGAGEAAEAVLGGGYEPHPSQDHGTIAAALEGVVASPDTGEALGNDQAMALLATAAQHKTLEAQQGEAEAFSPKERGRIWCRWSPPGWTVWDPLVLNPVHSRWLMRRVVVPVDVAHQMEILRKSVRRTLKPQAVYDDPMRDGRGIWTDGMPKSDEEDENGCVVLWEVWDGRFRTRHYLNEGCPEYLEASEIYPYYTRDGRVAVPGFFPAACCVGVFPPVQTPEAAFGRPLLAPGWPQQVEMVTLRSKMIAAAKSTVRVCLYSPNLQPSTKEALASGVDMNGVEAGDGDIQNQIFFPPIPKVPTDWDKELTLIERDFYNNVGISPAQFTGVGESDSATEADIAASAARTQISDVSKQIEEQIGRALMGMRGLVKHGYSPEHVTALVGQRYEPLFEAWKATSDEGDQIRVRLASRARDEDPVRVAQLEKALTVAMTVRDPVTGMPKVKPDRILSELFRALGVGEVEEYTPEEQAAMMQMAMLTAGAQAGPQGPGRGPGGGGEPGGNGKAAPEPSRGALAAGARSYAPVGRRGPERG